MPVAGKYYSTQPLEYLGVPSVSTKTEVQAEAELKLKLGKTPCREIAVENHGHSFCDDKHGALYISAGSCHSAHPFIV
jgi:hypothetical protein